MDRLQGEFHGRQRSMYAHARSVMLGRYGALLGSQERNTGLTVLLEVTSDGWAERLLPLGGQFYQKLVDFIQIEFFYIQLCDLSKGILPIRRSIKMLR